MQDRRSFLLTLGASVGGALVSGACRPRAAAALEQMAGAPLVSGPLGVQLYTVRDAMKRDTAGTLARVAKIGYREVEFAGYFDHSPAEIRRMLDDNGLRAPSSHIQVAPEGDGWKQTIDAAHVIGHEYLIAPWIPEEQRRTLDDFKRVADRFNAAGADAKRAGLRFGYHNHDFDFGMVQGQRLYDVLLASTDPSLVTMEMDVYWATKAGMDPLALFAKYPGRFSMLHLKDASPAPERAMRPVGEGTIDWRRIIPAGRAEGVTHMFVEHDNPTDPFASITESYRNLKG